MGHTFRPVPKVVVQAVLSAVLPMTAWCAEDPERSGLSLASPRVLCTATPTVAGRILVAGGLADSHSISSARADAELLDPSGVGRVVGSISLSGRLFPARFGHAAVPLGHGKVLLIGGDGQGSAERFDPAAGPKGGFVHVGSLPGGPRVDLTATLLLDGRVLIAGGMTPARKVTVATELLDPATGKITRGPNLVGPRTSHQAVRLQDGRVLLIGGVGRDDCEMFDPDGDRIVKGPGLRHQRDDHRATLLQDGSVLITGGQMRTGRSVRTAERFDPSTGKTIPVGDLVVDRADHAQLLLDDGSVLLLGGEQDGGRGDDTVLDEVERFDPATNGFVRMAPLKMPRDDHAALLLPDGRVVLIGGQTLDDQPLTAVEFYTPRRP